MGVKKEHSGDRCDLASILCKYDLRKGDLFVLSWTRVQRVCRVLCVGVTVAIWRRLIYGGGVRSILFFLILLNA